MGQRSSRSVFTTNRGRPGNPAPRVPLGKAPSASLHQWLWGQGPPRPPPGSASGPPRSPTPSPDCRPPGISPTLKFTAGTSGLICRPKNMPQTIFRKNEQHDWSTHPAFIKMLSRKSWTFLALLGTKEAEVRAVRDGSHGHPGRDGQEE